MTNEDLTIVLLDKIGWDYDKLLNPGHYQNTGDLLAGDLILAILSTERIIDVTGLIGFSNKSIITAITRFFIPRFGKLNGGGETWKFRLQHELGVKTCGGCKRLLNYDEYHSDKDTTRGITDSCKKCRILENKISSSLRSFKREHNNRIPGWADKEKIIDIYLKCPVDMQVDHIIPLQGGLVSGLHVENNLQYLSIKDNAIKSNKYIIE